jgi:hypothetical protein
VPSHLWSPPRWLGPSCSEYLAWPGGIHAAPLGQPVAVSGILPSPLAALAAAARFGSPPEYRGPASMPAGGCLARRPCLASPLHAHAPPPPPRALGPGYHGHPPSRAGSASPRRRRHAAQYRPPGGRIRAPPTPRPPLWVAPLAVKCILHAPRRSHVPTRMHLTARGAPGNAPPRGVCGEVCLRNAARPDPRLPDVAYGHAGPCRGPLSRSLPGRAKRVMRPKSPLPPPKSRHRSPRLHAAAPPARDTPAEPDEPPNAR